MEFRASLIADVVTGQVDVRMISAALSDFEPLAAGVDGLTQTDESPVDGELEMQEV
jgi:hypothetical protein